MGKAKAPRRAARTAISRATGSLANRSMAGRARKSTAKSMMLKKKQTLKNSQQIKAYSKKRKKEKRMLINLGYSKLHQTHRYKNDNHEAKIK